jgi:hypothetical protein
MIDFDRLSAPPGPLAGSEQETLYRSAMKMLHDLLQKALWERFVSESSAEAPRIPA